ncbi:MAG TPA: YwiC-like family protein [Polyangiales bacterium]
MSQPSEDTLRPARRRSAPGVSLWPREHGAYVQLLAPLACAALFGPRSLTAAAVAGAGCAAFMAHEPALVLLGRRGERARLQHGARAARRVALLGAAALLAAAWLWASGGELALALCVPVVLSLAATSSVLTGHERSLGGQLLSASTLASFPIPVLVAAGLPFSRALEFALGWTLVHVTATCAARAYVYRRKHGLGALQRAVAVAALGLAASVVLYAGGWLPLSFALATAPFVGLALLLTTRVLEFKSPKTLGWTLTVANVVAVVVFGLDLL